MCKCDRECDVSFDFIKPVYADESRTFRWEYPLEYRPAVVSCSFCPSILLVSFGKLFPDYSGTDDRGQWILLQFAATK